MEWRIQQTTQDKSRGLAVAFITSRAIQRRLDETVDYTVQDRKLSPDGKLTALSLCDRQGRPGNDQQLAQGICLRNVRLNQQRGRNNEVVNLLESYEIAT